MSYRTGLIKEQWECLDGGERNVAWTMAAAANAELTCVAVVDVVSIFATWYPDEYEDRYNHWLSQWRMVERILRHGPCEPLRFVLSEVIWLPELLEGVADGTLPIIVSPRCRAVRGFP